ncbi:MAG: (d)CMP kinase [Acidobacteriota bacterium]
MTEPQSVDGAVAAGGSDLVVAIDGPSGVGKSTVAGRLAERLGVPMLDTGAMYRAVALKVLLSGVDPDDRETVLRVAATADLALRRSASGKVEVMLDGEAVGGRIRTPKVSRATSKISTHPEIRQRLVELQRTCAARYGAVVEGRDIGSVVFPDTPHKFFLSARPEVRAERRHRELIASGKAVPFEQVLQDIEERDARDSGRRASPLVCDETYLAIDTSNRTVDQIVDRMVEAIESPRTAAAAASE